MNYIWTDEATQVVTDLIAAVLSDPAALRRDDAQRFNALPIGVGLWSESFLRPNGEVVTIGEDSNKPDEVTLSTDSNLVLQMLVWGARRYPELASLLPKRNADCIDCKCAGIPLFDRILCLECNGLRWVRR